MDHRFDPMMLALKTLGLIGSMLVILLSIEKHEHFAMVVAVSCIMAFAVLVVRELRKP